MMRHVTDRVGLALLALTGLTMVLLAGAWLSIRAEDAAPATGEAGMTRQDEDGLAIEQPTALAATMTSTLPIVVNNYAPPVPVFGVQMPAVTDAEGLVQVVGAGSRWVRILAFPWDQIEPVRTTPPTYNWAAVDAQSLINARAAGMETIAIVHFTPSWAQSIPGVSCGPIQPSALPAFAQFLRAAVERYSGPPYNVRYWELWNEPDIDPALVRPDSGFGCWGDIDDPYYGGRTYAQMLKVTYPAIKAASPEVKVLLGGLLLDCNPNNPPPGKDCTPGRYLEGVLVNGGGPYLDAISFHAYTYYWQDRDAIENPNWPGSVTAIPEKTAFLRQVLNAYGFPNKRLINSESALLCFDGTDSCWAAQARYMPRAYSEAMAVGLEAQVHYKMIMGAAWWHTGLIWSDLKPKPAYEAYAAAAAFLSATDYSGPATGYPAGVQGYAFRRQYGPASLDVVWSVDATPRTVTLAPGASAWDLYGNLIAALGDIQVDDSPVYVVGP